MENASKALIIAGAILLSILIISLGIMVYNQAKSTVGDANLNSEQVQTFNAKFTPYLGSVSGSKVNALIQAVIANNATNQTHQITMKISGTDYAAGTSSYPTLDNSTPYTVKVSETNGYVDGYISIIEVQ